MSRPSPALLPALCILLLAGCTTPDAKTAAPQAAQTADVFPAPAPSPQGPGAAAMTVPAGVSALDANALQADPTCRTKGNVTLCDAPFDPIVDATLHTN